MKTDKELLELAAKAAGIPRQMWDYEWVRSLGHMVTRKDMWNPFSDYGDAMRLAVKCVLHLGIEENVTSAWPAGDLSKFCSEVHHGDANYATRRAIVRAAAAIGEAMP